MNVLKRVSPGATREGDGTSFGVFVRRMYFLLVMRHIELYNGSEMLIDWKMFKGAIDFGTVKHNGFDWIGCA